MKRDPARHLASVPAGIRARLLADGVKLEPGAAAVTGRFFQIIAEHGDPLAAPSRSCFDLAARSEATLATLLRTLAAHAPEICLAGGREARKDWYGRRKKAGPRRRRGLAPLPASAPASWPDEWAGLYPALLSAPLRETSKRRFISSINRSAEALHRAGCEPDWSRWTAYCLIEVFEEEGLRPRTITSYLDALIALGTHGGIADDALDGIRDIRNLASARAANLDKLKVARIAELTERGGIEMIGEVIGALREKAACLPASSAATERMRRQAAILAVELQVYARTGDVSAWRFGEELIRDPCGTWRLEWMQAKTGGMRSPGELWPEIGEIVDELILAGRPTRYAGLQYQRLAGMNWLTHRDETMSSRQPSQLVREAIGVPLHDLRTLIADLMRRIDPDRAADLIATLLGHGSADAGRDYRALCTGSAAAQDWSQMRRQIADSNGKVLAA